MTIKNTKPQFVFFLLMVWLTLPGCIETYEEVNYPADSEAIRYGSELEEQLISISLKDGSYDNILDDASCLTVVYPVEAKLNGETFRINTVGELPAFEEEYRAKISNRDQFELVFPVTVVNESYQATELINQLELDQLAFGCVEGGSDQDIECVDMIYPINVSVYDPIYQKATIQGVTSDEEFYYLLTNRIDGDIVGFDFPITVLNSSGVNESIADNDALANVILADLNSCDEGDEKFGLGTGSELGKLKLFMTDAPYPIDSIESAYVRITEILMKYESGDARDFVLTDSIMVINIFELRNGVTETLTDTLINPGTVSGFSLIIDSAVINLKDGRAFDLKVPSGAQSGVKVKLSSDLEIIADEEVNVLLDFDLSKSFVPKGNDNNPNGINGFNFKPVLRAINLAEAGLITGQIFDASDNQTIEGVTITLNDSDGEFYASTFSEVSGSYALMGIDPGTYTLVIEKEGYILQEQSVTIIAQETLTADFELVID